MPWVLAGIVRDLQREPTDTDTAKPHIKVGHFSLIFLSDKLEVDKKLTVL